MCYLRLFGGFLCFVIGNAGAGISSLSAQEEQQGPLTDFSIPKYAPVVTAASFVNMASDARAGSMGDAGVAMEADVNSVFWNVAKMSVIKPDFSIAANYNPLFPTLKLNDLFLLNIAANYKIDERQAFFLYGKYMNIGKIDLRDINGEPIQIVSSYEFYVGGGYALSFSDNWSLGVGAKYIRSNILPGVTAIRGEGDFTPGNAFALDVGINYRNEFSFNKQIQWGLSLTSLGNKLSYGRLFRSDDNPLSSVVTGSNYLPAKITTGVGYTQQINDLNKISAVLDISKLLVPARPRDTRDMEAVRAYNAENVLSSWIKSFYDAPGGFSEELREFMFSLGAEYSYGDIFSFRTGFFYQDANKGGGSFYSMGVGLSYLNMFKFNLSYMIPLPFSTGQNTSPLANSLRLTFIYNFEKNP